MCSTQTDHLFGKQKREAEASRTLNFHKSTLDKIISSCIHPLLCLIYFAAFGQCDRRECIVFDFSCFIFRKCLQWGKYCIKCLNNLFSRIIYQIQRTRSTRKSSVQPTEIIRCQIFVRHIPLVKKDILPLSPLRLMASYGIGILHL